MVGCSWVNAAFVSFPLTERSLLWPEEFTALAERRTWRHIDSGAEHTSSTRASAHRVGPPSRPASIRAGRSKGRARRPKNDLPSGAASERLDPKLLGHSKIQTTFDVYGYLSPGSHDEVRARMDVYLAAGDVLTGAPDEIEAIEAEFEEDEIA